MGQRSHECDDPYFHTDGKEIERLNSAHMLKQSNTRQEGWSKLPHCKHAKTP